MANLWCEQCGQRVSVAKITLTHDFTIFDGEWLVRAYRPCLRCGVTTWHRRDAVRDKAHADAIRDTVTFVADSPVDGGLQNG